MTISATERPPIGAVFLFQHAMAVTDFKVDVSAREVVVHHIRQRHTFRFPIIDRATVSLRGAVIEPNRKAKRGARGYLLEAHKAARAAFE
jgi:hypothetical protein